MLTWDGERPAFVTARVTEDYRVPLWWHRPRSRSGVPPTTLVLAGERGAAPHPDQAGASPRSTPSARTLPCVAETARGRGCRHVGRRLPERLRDCRPRRRGPSRRSRRPRTGPADPRSPVARLPQPAGLRPARAARASRSCVSHEATHVALERCDGVGCRCGCRRGSPTTSPWSTSDVPDAVLAAQIRRLVRDEGAPADLPGRAEFDGGNRGHRRVVRSGLAGGRPHRRGARRGRAPRVLPGDRGGRGHRPRVP